ncbi:hypothetical protein O3M35_008988 [Rhynocoris fuscipes]|uniref:Tetratricopeptide repeat protein 5 OB fold domain-containing protein n=1 Tax=Rhynocoris fuscipes TaxID=488301 RepID=A0AAW1D8B0_9HEMI
MFTLSEKVKSLVKLKNEYKIFLVENLEEKLDKLLKDFLENEEILLKENSVEYWLRLGQLYCLTENQKSRSIEPLLKALKLDGNLTEALNELGENYWHNNDALKAQNYFEKALSNDPNVNRQEFLLKGIELAKEAVDLDVEDGISWTILGNSYLSAYFGIRQDKQFAKMALSAYKQAEILPNAEVNNDLFYNKAIVLKYLEMYEEVLQSIDKSLTIQSNWQPAVKLKDDLLKYLNNVSTLNSNKGKIKRKRIIEFQKELNEMQKERNFLEFKNDNLLAFSELKVGLNFSVIACGKVIWNLSQDESFPFTFGLMDFLGNSMVVTVYNLTPGKGFIVGDTVMIPKPFIIQTNFDYDNRNFNFTTIRVDKPNEMIVNKRKLPSSWCTAFLLLTTEKDSMND